MKKKIFSLLCLLTLIFTGCSSGGDDGVYTAGIISNIESLDATKASYSQTIDLFADIYSGLTKINGDGEVELSEAESIDISEDGLVYTIKLKEGLKWVDNTGAEMGDVTANDYVFGYQRMVDPASAALYGYIFESVKNADDIMAGEKDPSTLGVKAIDDYTLEITLETATPYFESMLAFQMLIPQSKEAYDLYGSDYGTGETTTWYNGPYYVTSFDTDYIVSLEKNPLYYNADNVQVERIDYRLFEDTSSAFQAFENGELDYTTVTNGEIYDQYQSEGVIQDNLTGYSFYAVLNTDDSAVTSNENLRKGLAYGFDRESAVELAYGSINESIEYIIPADMTPVAYDGAEYRDVAGDSLITFDKTKADEYFDAYMEDMGYTERSQIEVTYLSSDTTQPLAEAVQTLYSQDFGITINILTQPFEQMTQTKKSGGFDMFVTGWGPDYPDPSTYLSLWQSSNIGSLNDAFYNNASYDEAYKKANAIQDTQARFEAFASLEKQLVDEAVLVPIYQKNEPFAMAEEYEMPTHLFFQISHEYLTTNETGTEE